MDELIPIFPLELVVYPGESLNLHIFEPRYQQLIEDCELAQMPFGIPSVVEKTVPGLGTLVQLTAVSNLQPDGQRDIKTRALKIFRIVELRKLYPGKLYSAAIVEYPEIDHTPYTNGLPEVLATVKKLHQALRVEKKFSKPDAELTSYDLAHHVGLSVAQEYALLELFSESDRLAYLKKHLDLALPVVTGMESLKEKIQLNGHFKNLPGFEI